MAARKARVKWIFDMFWNRGNEAEGRPRRGDVEDDEEEEEVLCGLCDCGPDGVPHIVHGCEHPLVAAARASGLAAIRRKFTQWMGSKTPKKGGKEGKAKAYPALIRDWRFVLAGVAEQSSGG